MSSSCGCDFNLGHQATGVVNNDDASSLSNCAYYLPRVSICGIVSFALARLPFPFPSVEEDREIGAEFEFATSTQLSIFKDFFKAFWLRSCCMNFL
jgi:hypothetical protein